MKKLLLIVAIALASCGTQKETVKNREPIYRDQALSGKISIRDYFYLIDAEKELKQMKGGKR